MIPIKNYVAGQPRQFQHRYGDGVAVRGLTADEFFDTVGRLSEPQRERIYTSMLKSPKVPVGLKTAIHERTGLVYAI